MTPPASPRPARAAGAKDAYGRILLDVAEQHNTGPAAEDTKALL
jgi:hypothetical protein